MNNFVGKKKKKKKKKIKPRIKDGQLKMYHLVYLSVN